MSTSHSQLRMPVNDVDGSVGVRGAAGDDGVPNPASRVIADDEEIGRLLGSGGPDAENTGASLLIDKYERALLAAAPHNLNDATANEVVWDAITALVLRTMRGKPWPEFPFGYLLGIVKNAARSNVRTNDARTRRNERFTREVLSDGLCPPSSEDIANERMEILEELMNVLTERDRQRLRWLLDELQEKSYAQIALESGQSEVALRQHHSRTRQKLTAIWLKWKRRGDV